MLAMLLSGAAVQTAEFSTVAIRMPKALHSELQDLSMKHGLTLQAVGEIALESALAELRGAPVRVGVVPTKRRGGPRKAAGK